MVKTVEPKGSAGKSIVSLKVTLRDIKPPIWRRLLVPGTMTLGDLHQAIQAAMGWDNDHLHAFDIAGRQYGDRDTVDDVADENRLTVNSLVKSGVARFAYTYDFGDNWEHLVVIEKCAPAVEVISYPACVAGKRNCPPELRRRLELSAPARDFGRSSASRTRRKDRVVWLDRYVRSRKF
jgi:hypothetical protein